MILLSKEEGGILTLLTIADQLVIELTGGSFLIR